VMATLLPEVVFSPPPVLVVPEDLRLRETTPELPEWLFDVRGLVQKNPLLARTDADVLKVKVEKFRQLMAPHVGSEKVVATVVAQQPSVILIEADALDATVRQLRDIVDDVSSLLTSRPLLLKQSAKALLATWSSLRRRASTVTRWRVELESLRRRTQDANVLGGLLLGGTKKHHRLAAVAKMPENLRDSHALAQLLTMRDSTFQDTFQDAFLRQTKGPSPLLKHHRTRADRFPLEKEERRPSLSQETQQRGQGQRQPPEVRGFDDVEAPADQPPRKKRSRGSPYCPKCANPKCHRSHTYEPPCARCGMPKPERRRRTSVNTQEPNADEPPAARSDLVTVDNIPLIPPDDVDSFLPDAIFDAPAVGFNIPETVALASVPPPLTDDRQHYVRGLGDTLINEDS